MKCPKRCERKKTGKRAKNAPLNDDVLKDLLKICLQRVCQLQHNLNNTGEENTAEAAGYAACAAESLKFLTEEGIAPDHPIMRELQGLFARNGI
ncbi:hypothetical protein FQA39_LY10203 [Lamprigera yunnana]|nr:hypothetical protein FQA39_LY10203 [Lamprigera yunnana]